jgi:hypothetical protein
MRFAATRDVGMDLLGFFLGRRLREDDLHKFTGVVLESKTWSETHVSGGGGGGSLMPGAAVASSSPVSSTVTTKNQFFLSRDDGGELIVTTTSDFAVRAGTRLVIYAFQSSLRRNFKNFVAYGNVQTASVALEPGWTKTLSRILPRPFMAAAALALSGNLLPLILVGFVSGSLASLGAGMIVLIWAAIPVAFIGLWVVRLKREGEVRAKIERKFAEDRRAELLKLETSLPKPASVVP